ncbi:hypothetical protein KBT16_21465 [Nostoc sp. CCCryo 231-06]|nr:hypothetical protein [Nostoc sp. CCCryo 231-06]
MSLGSSNSKWLGRKSGLYKWYEIQDNVAYYLEFNQPKIIYQEISTYQSFTLDYTGKYVNKKFFIIPTENLYLFGVLNSCFVWEFLQNTCSKLSGGALAMQTPYVTKISIPNASTTEREAISQLVQKCLDEKGINCEIWEKEIDERVAALYGL